MNFSLSCKLKRPYSKQITVPIDKYTLFLNTILSQINSLISLGAANGFKNTFHTLSSNVSYRIKKKSPSTTNEMAVPFPFLIYVDNINPTAD